MGQILDSLLGGDPVMQVDVDFQRTAFPRLDLVPKCVRF
jgi:hypothetical protein